MTELATGKQISRSQIGNNVMCFSNAPLSASEAFSSPVSPPPFMVGMAEVEIDKETGVLELIDYVAVVDCGTVINRTLRVYRWKAESHRESVWHCMKMLYITRRERTSAIL